MDAIRNTDWIGKQKRANYFSNFQRVVVVDAEEPVSVAEIKTHGRIDFDDEDTYIALLNPAARRMVEDYTGISLIPTTVTVTLTSGASVFELPYGPYVSGLTVVDENAVTIAADNYDIIGSGFASLEYLAYGDYTLSYLAGYSSTTIPPNYKLAIMHQAIWLYEHRGDGSIAPMVKALAPKRGTWLI